MHPRLFLSLGILLALFAFAAPAAADHHEGGPAVSNVLIFNTGGQFEKFLGFTQRAQDIRTRLGVAGVQNVWFASYGGPSPGAVIVTIEYPSLSAFAAAETKARASAEWNQFVGEVAAAGIQIMSNAVLTNVTP